MLKITESQTIVATDPSSPGAWFGVEVSCDGTVRAVNEDGQHEDILGDPELTAGMIGCMMSVLSRVEQLRKEKQNENV